MQKNELIHRIFNAIICGAAFILIGYFLPKLYVLSVPDDYYVTFNNSVTTENSVYHSCDQMMMITTVDSRINTHLLISVSLRLIELKTDKSVYGGSFITYVTQGHKSVKEFMNLPCGLQTGNYFWEGMGEYEVFGIKKYLVWKTEPFEIAE